MSEKLIHAYLDGSITAPEMQQLNALLLADADARREFAEILNVDSALAARLVSRARSFGSTMVIGFGVAIVACPFQHQIVSLAWASPHDS